MAIVHCSSCGWWGTLETNRSLYENIIPKSFWFLKVAGELGGTFHKLGWLDLSRSRSAKNQLRDYMTTKPTPLAEMEIFHLTTLARPARRNKQESGQRATHCSCGLLSIPLLTWLPWVWLASCACNNGVKVKSEKRARPQRPAIPGSCYQPPKLGRSVSLRGNLSS